jgi:hypothetical protein
VTNDNDLMQPAQLALTKAFDVSKQILGPDHGFDAMSLDD